MKTKSPTSIRFDEDQLKFIKEKENLQSGQEVVNFLMNGYWEMYHPRKPVFAPAINYQVATKDDYDGKRLPKGFVHDEYGQAEIPKPVEKPPVIKDKGVSKPIVEKSGELTTLEKRRNKMFGIK